MHSRCKDLSRPIYKILLKSFLADPLQSEHGMIRMVITILDGNVLFFQYSWTMPSHLANRYKSTAKLLKRITCSSPSSKKVSLCRSNYRQSSVYIKYSIYYIQYKTLFKYILYLEILKQIMHVCEHLTSSPLHSLHSTCLKVCTTRIDDQGWENICEESISLRTRPDLQMLRPSQAWSQANYTSNYWNSQVSCSTHPTTINNLRLTYIFMHRI